MEGLGMLRPREKKGRGTVSANARIIASCLRIQIASMSRMYPCAECAADFAKFVRCAMRPYYMPVLAR